MKNYFVYFMANYTNTVLYTGVTNDLSRRVNEHKTKSVKGFTEKYNCNKLVYFETTDDVSMAIFREKQIKAGSRVKKNKLVERMNPEWKDLSIELFGI